MVRPEWHSPRHSDSDTSETLQSDVMRFIAILALCLVAIFAMVQSLPVRQVAEPNAAEPAVEKTPPVSISTARSSPERVNRLVAHEIEQTPLPTGVPMQEKATNAPLPPPRRIVPVPAPMPVRPVVDDEQPDPEPLATPAQPRRPVVQMPETPPKPAQPAQRQEEAPVKASAAAAQEGLILRFASDTALLALVAQRRVEVYAWVRDTALQLSSKRGVLSFAPTAAPKHFHSMMPDTVPSAIARALASAAPTARAGTVTWGVTLPADTKRQLERLVMQHQSGTLVIENNGRVRFRQAG